ncbi:MAG: APC family permease [Congregibacter sp.]
MMQAEGSRKTLRQRDMVLFTVSAILLPDTLASAASIGASSVSWWVILSLAFLLPFALISAELGASYPEQGGVYAWIRDAFGGRWGSRITWCYWINTAVWLPSVCILFSGILKQLFFPDATLWWQIGVAVAVCLSTVGVSCLALDLGKWVPNIGALAKFLFFGAIIAGAWFFTSKNGMANPLTIDSMTPDFGEGLQFIPAIIYGMLGFELVSAGSDEMRNPARDVPRAVITSGLLVSLLYTLGTVAVLAAIPAQDINLVEGLVDTLRLFFAGPLENFLVITLGISVLFAVFASGSTWAIGVNRAAAEAGGEGELPAVFAVEHPRTGTPIGAALLMGVTSSGMLLIYGFVAGTNEDLFWSLFAFSGVIFFLPYIAMVFAFLELRRRDPAHARPFKVPGGSIVASVFALVCIATLSTAALLFMYTPGEGPDWPVVIGVGAMLTLGEMLVRYAEHQTRKRKFQNI